jgi:hypothetical protein
MRCYGWLLAVVMLTWPTVDARLIVEIERRTQGKSAVVMVGDGTVYYDTTVPQGRSCWRWRYVIPQRSERSDWVCLRVGAR